MTIVRVAAGMAALALSAQVALAQQPSAPQHPQPGGMVNPPGMSPQQTRMMDSLNTRLDSLVSRMNRATGNTKVAAMADVINELVAQRRAMHEHMRTMMQSREGMPMMRHPPMHRPPPAAPDTGKRAPGAPTGI